MPRWNSSHKRYEGVVQSLSELDSQGNQFAGYHRPVPM
jgi:hypothetical protein